MDDRSHYKGADIGGDEVKQQVKLGQLVDVLLKKRKYHELAQEQTDYSNEEENK